MPKMVLLAMHLEVDSNTLDQWIHKAELTAEIEEQEVTTYASLGWTELEGGLASGTLAVDFRNDFDASAINSILWPLFLGRTPVSFLVRTDQASVGMNNPNWTGEALITNPGMIGGTVGEVAEGSVSWPTSGAISRATS